MISQALRVQCTSPVSLVVHVACSDQFTSLPATPVQASHCNAAHNDMHVCIVSVAVRLCTKHYRASFHGSERLSILQISSHRIPAPVLPAQRMSIVPLLPCAILLLLI